jgi:hypothetical protein
MTEFLTQGGPAPPGSSGGEISIEKLNHSCFCLSVDPRELRRSLEADLEMSGLALAMMETHPYLFAYVPLFIAREHIERMAQVVRAVETVVATPAFRSVALTWAPPVASYDPGCRGGLLGYDFHLGVAGIQLIEINTNPGGALLNVVLGRAQRGCCPSVIGLAMAPTEADAIEAALFEVFMAEWRLQRKDAPLKSVAIVDESPKDQYLYLELLLYQQLLSRHGIKVTICDPRELARKNARLWKGDMPIDFVYNRLTDFALEQSAYTAMYLAYLAGEIVLSPNPRAHALYADKRNLTLLCDEMFLHNTGVGEETVATLCASVPRTEIMTSGNRDELWARRQNLFFKPAAGFGSKAAYRGDKLTKGVWDDMTKGMYVAQALVTPSERNLADSPVPRALKSDIRNYAYAGVVKLVAARLYQGQTTNFRTPGGGFAPVFTERQ